MPEQLKMPLDQALKIVDDVFKATNGNRETHSLLQTAQTRIAEELTFNQIVIARLQKELDEIRLSIPAHLPDVPA